MRMMLSTYRAFLISKYLTNVSGLIFKTPCINLALIVLSVCSVPGSAQDQFSTNKNSTGLERIVMDRPAVVVVVSAPDLVVSPGDIFSVPINVSDTTGLGIFGYRFQISFDPAVIQPSGPNFGCSVSGTQSAGASGVCNLFPNAQTITGFYSTVVPLSGTAPLINLTFQAVGPLSSVSPLTFVDFFFNEGNPMDVTIDGSVGIFAPSAAGATVSGQVLDATSRPISNVRVSLTDSSGGIRNGLSGPLGYYQIDDVEIGQSYVLEASSKRHVFVPRILSVTDNITDQIVSALP